jgi:hypothetical protein
MSANRQFLLIRYHPILRGKDSAAPAPALLTKRRRRTITREARLMSGIILITVPTIQNGGYFLLTSLMNKQRGYMEECRISAALQPMLNMVVDCSLQFPNSGHSDGTRQYARGFDYPRSEACLWTKAMNYQIQRLPTDSSFGASGERSARISRIGGWPKRRLYSRLNCVQLS